MEADEMLIFECFEERLRSAPGPLGEEASTRERREEKKRKRGREEEKSDG